MLGGTADLDSGLVAYYPFGENTNDGSWKGNNVAACGATYVSGKVGQRALMMG